MNMNHKNALLMAVASIAIASTLRAEPQVTNSPAANMIRVSSSTNHTKDKHTNETSGISTPAAKRIFMDYLRTNHIDAKIMGIMDTSLGREAVKEAVVAVTGDRRPLIAIVMDGNGKIIKVKPAH